MSSTDFIFRQQENLVDNQKCQAGFRQQNTIEKWNLIFKEKIFSLMYRSKIFPGVSNLEN